jgi:maltose alpha-D-glucosyltransferase / alpha-amylase
MAALPLTQRSRPLALQRDNLWYKDAVIYQLHVRTFYDSNADGVGDFPGLTQKLDYLQQLGITAIWLLPFYPSPLRDDGYDIADYTSVNPTYGSLEEFKAFLNAAHSRGIRVIIELVLNHTSDQHPWFQEARSSRDNPRRDWYVWSDTDAGYKGVPIVFVDTEVSNWAWDPISKSYYWHRFFSHQPDLNYDNPAVFETIWDVMRFWLDLGVDGFRLDAVAFLVEREGTSCENLPETHAIIREFRKRLDISYPGTMLLAEANQWPADVRAYFGDSDEFHAAFHFPLMPRMFMAVKLEDRKPIVEILAQTPEIPESCQWFIFLRNHDELTLEMVTDVERDYMYDEYATDTTMRINRGIRRRLAPMMNNDRRRIELLNGLLMSMPGTPIIYYGDEIGMGDNIYLGDRNGVRTPMQWSPRLNAGFSQADPERLYAPVISNAVCGYQAVNVDAQERSEHSLLNWMKSLIPVRNAFRAFSRGSLQFLDPANPRVLAYTRQFGDEIVLVVNNLSNSAQAVELNVQRYKGYVPIEMFGRNLFPRFSDLPYLLTLGNRSRCEINRRPHPLALTHLTQPLIERHPKPMLWSTPYGFPPACWRSVARMALPPWFESARSRYRSRNFHPAPQLPRNRPLLAQPRHASASRRTTANSPARAQRFTDRCGFCRRLSGTRARRPRPRRHSQSH